MPISVDLSSPNSALQSYENAFRLGDLDAARACRHPYQESRLMLHHLGDGSYADNAALVQKGAEVLEMAWRREALPNFDGVTTNVVSVESHWDCFSIATQRVEVEGGERFYQRMVLANIRGQWFVICPAELYERRE